MAAANSRIYVYTIWEENYSGIATSPVTESLPISANTALSQDFGLRQIASVKCRPYIMLLDHGPGPGPSRIVWTK